MVAHSAVPLVAHSVAQSVARLAGEVGRLVELSVAVSGNKME